MNILITVMSFINNLGVAAFMPFLITIIGLIFGMKLMKAFRSGLLIGAGFVGINTLVTVIVTALYPLAIYYASLGSGFTAVPVGWEIAGSIAWSSPFAVAIVPLGFLLNFLLIKFRVTKTLNVDLWNYWYFMLNAMYVWFTAKSLGASETAAAIIGCAAGLLFSVLACIFADLFAKQWQTHYGLEGTSCTTQGIHSLWGIIWVVDKIIDKIPGLKKVNVSVEKLQTSKFSFLGDVPVISFLFMVIIMLVSKQTIATTLSTSVTVMAVIVMLPKMVAILMEGLTPIGAAAQAFMMRGIEKQRAKDIAKNKDTKPRELYIGMDCALSLGDPCGLACIPLIIPVVLVLQFVLPVNYIMVTGLASALYVTCGISMITKGEIVKTIIGYAIFTTIVALLTTWLSPQATAVFSSFRPDLGSVAADSTGNLFNTVIFLVGKLFKAF